MIALQACIDALEGHLASLDPHRVVSVKVHGYVDPPIRHHLARAGNAAPPTALTGASLRGIHHTKAKIVNLKSFLSRPTVRQERVKGQPAQPPKMA